MTLEELQCLLERPEADTLDFKRDDYGDLTAPDKRSEFTKDVLSMANTPRTGDAHIVLGVSWSAASGSSIVGLPIQRDDAIFQAAIGSNRVSPRPLFYYTPMMVKDLAVGIITIPSQTNGPFVPSADFPGLQAGAIYFRRGTTKVRALGDEIKIIYDWFRDGVTAGLDQQTARDWRDFLHTIGGFDPLMRYLLLADRLPAESAGHVSELGLAPWRAVVDLDRASETTGLLSKVAFRIEPRRVIHRALATDLNVSPEPGVHWYFASGVEGDLALAEDHKAWLKRHKRALSDHLVAIQAALSPSPICVVALWSASAPPLLRTIVEEAYSAFGDSCTVVVVGQDRPALEPICEEAGASYFDISLRSLSAGIGSVIGGVHDMTADTIQIPTASGAPLQLATDDQPWLTESLEIVHLASGLHGEDASRPFRLGSMVTWRNLQLGQDCTRDVTAQVRMQVEDDLKKRDVVRINLYHFPGGGGSTVARRILWDLHTLYPAVVLLQYVPLATAERIAKLAALSENSVLVLVDGGTHSDREIDELFEQLKAQQVRVVLLQTLRRFQFQGRGKRQFWLQGELSQLEADRFRHALAVEVPFKEAELRALAANPGRTRSPFFFGLAAFGREFLALRSYVATRLGEVTKDQRRVLAYLSLAYYYGQQSLPAQSFAGLLGLPPSRPVKLEGIFASSAAGALDLLVGDAKGDWRSAHQEIALETLKQIIGGDAKDSELIWRQSLSVWSKEFADFIRGEGSVPSERLIELARRVFVYRDNTELLGTERTAGGAFSQLIEDIPSMPGRIDVLHHLSDKFPDEAHFHAHFGRILASQGDFERAKQEASTAVALSSRDHVLHHMRGMILRQEIRSCFDSRRPVTEIVPLVEQAQSSFNQSRDLRPDNEHGYVSEIQLLLHFLDAAAAQERVSVQAYISNPTTPAFCRTLLDQIETLIDRVSNLYVGESPSRYIEDCRARVQRIYGDYAGALQSFDRLMSRPDVQKAPLRRQIVWTMLRRRDGQWAKLSSQEVERARQLLEENLVEEIRDSASLRLWLRAVRLGRVKPTLDSVIERVAYWKSNTGALDAIYYLYVLNGLKAMEGSAQAVVDMEKTLDECRSLARYRRDRTRSLEWIGNGSGVAKLVHQSQLGEWRDDFREFPEILARVEGRVKSIGGPEKGIITVAGNLEAFYVPARSDIHSGGGENVRVTCYLGFSYDGLRAWAVSAHRA